MGTLTNRSELDVVATKGTSDTGEFRILPINEKKANNWGRTAGQLPGDTYTEDSSPTRESQA